MNYLARLKLLEDEKTSHYAPVIDLPIPPKAPFVSFVGTGTGHFEKRIIDAPGIHQNGGAHFLWMIESKNNNIFKIATFPPSTLTEILRDFPDTVAASPIPETEHGGQDVH